MKQRIEATFSMGGYDLQEAELAYHVSRTDNCDPFI